MNLSIHFLAVEFGFLSKIHKKNNDITDLALESKVPELIGVVMEMQNLSTELENRTKNLAPLR